MKVVSIERSRSGEAEARCSCRKQAGSILLGAVIAWSSFRSAVRGLQKITRWPPYTRLRPSPGWSHTTLADATRGAAVADALWMADMTTGPTGRRMDYSDRLTEILQGYEPDSIVARAM